MNKLWTDDGWADYLFILAISDANRIVYALPLIK